MEEEQPGGEATTRDESVTDINSLPEDCISNILSFTSPLDACTSSLVSHIFRSAAKSDSVWEKFFPSDYRSMISRSDNCSSLNFPSKKELFSTLCLNPLLIDDDKKRFWLDKQSGKKCYMLGARDLVIIWGDTPEYWIWKQQHGWRFSEIAELKLVWWFEIRGKIDTSMLSPTTAYAIYLVYKMRRHAYGFDYPYEASVGTAISERQISRVCLVPDLYRRQQQLDDNEAEVVDYDDEDVDNEAEDVDNGAVDVDDDEAGDVDYDDSEAEDVDYDDNEAGDVDDDDDNEAEDVDEDEDVDVDNEDEDVDDDEAVDYYDNNMLNLPQPKKRSDKWLEVELGEYYNEHGDDGELEISIMEVTALFDKSGIVVLGIEIRPKS